MANENNIFKCKRCHATFIGQEFDGHLCTPVLKEMKLMEFDYYRITKDEMNREVIMIKSMDGILYSFVKREEKETDKIPYDLPLLPTESQQSQLTYQQRRETPDKDNNTIIIIILTYWPVVKLQVDRVVKMSMKNFFGAARGAYYI